MLETQLPLNHLLYQGISLYDRSGDDCGIGASRGKLCRIGPESGSCLAMNINKWMISSTSASAGTSVPVEGLTSRGKTGSPQAAYHQQFDHPQWHWKGWQQHPWE